MPDIIPTEPAPPVAVTGQAFDAVDGGQFGEVIAQSVFIQRFVRMEGTESGWKNTSPGMFPPLHKFYRLFGCYGVQISSARRSGTNPCAGAWVIMRSIFAASAAAWGVTPQAQNTGTNSAGIVDTAGPKSGAANSAPMPAGSPM